MDDFSEVHFSSLLKVRFVYTENTANLDSFGERN